MGIESRCQRDVASLTTQAARLFERRTQENPRILASLFGLLRVAKSTLVSHGLAVVTRFEDVQEILSRDKVFTVAPYSSKMETISGRFILGLEDSAEYERDVSVLRLAAGRDDLSRVADIVDQTATRLVSESTGQMDVVRDLTDAVPTQLAREYFGVMGPDDRTLVQWARILFREIFINIRDDPTVTVPAQRASAEMRTHIEHLIATRKADLSAEHKYPDDVLSRLLQAQSHARVPVSDQWIRTYLIGLIIGMLPLISKATSLAIDYLFNRPNLLASAQWAARHDEDDRVADYVFEAMRFAPQAPGQFRLCVSDYIVAEGTRHQARIPSGTLTFVATQSAMFDGRVVTRPGQFRIDRPWYQYLHFGYGMHSCFGRYIARVQIPLMVKALLRQRNLRRAANGAGCLTWEGPFPASLLVEFDPA